MGKGKLVFSLDRRLPFSYIQAAQRGVFSLSLRIAANTFSIEKLEA
jgi:hypothetical protein